VLNLAIFALVILVASTLWFLLRPPAPLADEDAAPDDAPSAAGDDLAEPSGYHDMRVITPPQSDERAPNH